MAPSTFVTFISFLPLLGSAALVQELRIRQNCADVNVVFARGTTEPAPIGAVVGPPFQQALQSQLGSQTLSFQGVDYPASIQGFLEGGDSQGSTAMAQMVEQTASQCAGKTIVMSGYSQGAQLVHNAANQLSASAASSVKSVVMFGDPDDGQQLGNGLSAVSKTFCNQGDNICQGGDLVLPPHLAYGANAGDAATFVVGNLQNSAAQSSTTSNGTITAAASQLNAASSAQVTCGFVFALAITNMFLLN